MKLAQRQAVRADLRLLGLQSSQLLEMSEPDYIRWIRTIEESPLFRILHNPSPGQRKVVRRRPWGRFHFQELTQEPADRAAAASLPPVTNDVRALALRIGRENFERYFLHNEGEFDAAAAAASCGLHPEEARRLFRFLDDLDIARGSSAVGEAPAVPVFRQVVAALERAGRRLTVEPVGVHYARGLYQIDYDALQELKRSRPGDWKAIRDLVRRLELANRKQTILGGLLRLLTEMQKDYFLRGDSLALRPFSQKEAARRLDASASGVCRALEGRRVRTPWGEERDIKDFFPSRKQVAVFQVGALLGKQPGLRDGQLRELLLRRRIRVSRRSVNVYRRTAERTGIL